MFHKAVSLEFCEGTTFEVTFQSGEVKKYDISVLFSKYPQLEVLKDRTVFLNGKLIGAYGIVWNDELDIEVETVYEDGVTVRKEKALQNTEIGSVLLKERADAGISQKELSAITGIDQADISKIECGIANPTVAVLKRLASAFDKQLRISFE